MFEKILIFLSCLIGLCSDAETQKTPDHVRMPISEYIQKMGNQDMMVTKDGGIVFMRRSTTSGNFLASTFAQTHHDWDQASVFLDGVLRKTPENDQLLSRAMVLAMGAGQHEKGLKIAHKLYDLDSQHVQSLPMLFLLMEAFKAEDYNSAQTYLKSLPEGSIADFIRPLLSAWLDAAKGEMNARNLIQNTIHIYHAFLIGDFLDKRDDFSALLQVSLNAEGLSVQDIERMGDVYTLIGEHETAQKLYNKALENWPDNKTLQTKSKALKAGETPVFFESVDGPADGVAMALFDMSQLLFNENSDDSARVFAQMALYLDPSMIDARIMLGYIAARHEQYDDALKHYAEIPLGHPRYLEAQRISANLLQAMGRTEDAVDALDGLAQKFDDIDALIQIGNIYRQAQDFKKAVDAYDRAESALGGKITDEYWHLHYVRGMALERAGRWSSAEKDLKAALSFRPNYPLVLNYLGYAWADKGEHLDQALDMIRKAVSLEPDDGYITDSLGWVLYRMGQFEEAVPHLERAVELLPYDAVVNDHLGDAYWQVGRKLEARFQWQRAQNHVDDDNEALLSDIHEKLEHGLSVVNRDSTAGVKEARIESSP